MRIGLISTLATPVLADGAGSVESLVYVLARELSAAGDTVTVFATADSSPPCELVAALPGRYGRKGSPGDWHACEWINACRAVERSDRLDVLHSHSYLNAVPLQPLAHCPIVHTTHVLPHRSDAQVWETQPDSVVTAVSEFQWAGYPHLRPAAVVPHGLDRAPHTFRERPDDYLCFLGRFTQGKGPLDAIATARELAMPLRMAAPANDYYTAEIEAHIDGAAVTYVGPVGHDARDNLLGGARALLYPVRDAEPFGLVLVEAMLSGTPVAAFDVGAVPEIVEDGLTGAIVPVGGDLAAGVRRCLELDRRAVRARAEERFVTRRMVAGYRRVYEAVSASRATA